MKRICNEYRTSMSTRRDMMCLRSNNKVPSNHPKLLISLLRQSKNTTLLFQLPQNTRVGEYNIISTKIVMLAESRLDAHENDSVREETGRSNPKILMPELLATDAKRPIQARYRRV